VSTNPYQSPSSAGSAVGVLSGKREDLKNVAKYQKGILVCILIYLIAVLSSLLLPADIRQFVGFGVILVGLVGTVFVFLLAMKVYGIPIGILLGILAMVPCVGLIVLLMINGKATSVLKQNGIKVGFMGANLAEL
jgi:hypothetical protein